MIISDKVRNETTQYAKDECTHPVRTVTAVVRVANRTDTMVSVKTAAPIPKELVFRVMEEINAACAPKTTKIGDIIIKNILGTGADVVATSNINK